MWSIPVTSVMGRVGLAIELELLKADTGERQKLTLNRHSCFSEAAIRLSSLYTSQVNCQLNWSMQHTH